MFNKQEPMGKLNLYFRKNSDIATLSCVLAAVVLLMIWLNPGQFLKSDNFESMAFQLPELGILALAMAVAMLSGGINLSIVASANFVGIVMAIMMTKIHGMDPGLLIPLAIITGLAVSAVIGILNGVIISMLDVSPILATLGSSMVIDGASLIITKGYVISGYPDTFLNIGNGYLFGIPFPLFILIFCIVGVSVLLTRTIFGQSIYLLGSNTTAARFSGINIKAAIIKTYAISGLLCGIASIIMISRFNSASQGYSTSYLLITVLLAVLGGFNPDGGFGKVSGLVLALIILQIISSGLNIFGLSSYLTLIIWGAILLLVMGVRAIGVKYGK
ncbi:MAG TPA: sugar ABC transporter permease [Firmicutes bacterium]|jgi:simple sugar transport system permease protein|nr:sugar ABC transporter permease [Bacillota bacterium]